MSKNGFLLYGNYEEQVKRLNDAQAGELFKIILHYVNTGEMRKSSDALVDMVFSMIAFQLGFDMNNMLRDEMLVIEEDGKSKIIFSACRRSKLGIDVNHAGLGIIS